MSKIFVYLTYTYSRVCSKRPYHTGSDLTSSSTSPASKSTPSRAVAVACRYRETWHNNNSCPIFTYTPSHPASPPVYPYQFSSPTLVAPLRTLTTPLPRITNACFAEGLSSYCSPPSTELPSRQTRAAIARTTSHCTRCHSPVCTPVAEK
jgi:hypothetical protein